MGSLEALKAAIACGDINAALDVLQRIAPMDPAFIEARRLLIAHLIAKGRYHEADRCLNDVSSIRPNLIWALDLRVALATEIGDFSARLQALGRLFQLAPEKPERLGPFITALLEAGELERARTALAEHELHVRHAMRLLPGWSEPTCSKSESEAHRLRRLYLDLLERTVSNWIYGDQENRLGKILPFDPTLRACGKDIPLQAHTMIGLTRLRHLRVLAEDAITAGIPGDFVEAGVWRGGACILLAGILRAWGEEGRAVVAADSFAGLPAPDPRYAKDALTTFDFHLREELAVGADEVRENFERYGLWSPQIKLLVGLFKDTLPKYPYGSIALLRLDGDLYSSTMDTLDHLYDRVSPGGYVISDDYGAVIDARRAVLDFRAKRNIAAELIRVDDDAVYWKKD